MRLEELGFIGNCQFAAHVHQNGSVVWCCLPRFDSPPAFGRLLDEEGGEFRVGTPSGTNGVQRYVGNTNILETIFESEGGTFRVLDFAPRFPQNERTYRPTRLLRIIEPLVGVPLVQVRCDPRLGWDKTKPRRDVGSNHISFSGFPSELRLTTDVPLSYLDGKPFTLARRKHLILSYGEPVVDPIATISERFFLETKRYWERWVKHCNIPSHYQREVIRSALALKLHCFEDTGAIVAATTTSIPESPGSGRTWDYRYCWLRDAYYALAAFRRIGHFEEREQFVEFLMNIAASSKDLDVRPLYRVDGGVDLEESILEHWAGFRGEGPVRVGNAAVHHQQNDIFGEMVLALAPIFMDARFEHERMPTTERLLLRFADKACNVAGTPDAGIWEVRKEWTPQTFSTLMCWAAASRAGTVAVDPGTRERFERESTRIREMLLNEGWSSKLGALTSEHGGQHLDAAMLQAATLKLLPPNDPRLHSTIDAIRRDLDRHGWLLRYRSDDGLGVPQVAFVLCTFWLVEALAHVGRGEEARAILDEVKGVMTPLGLLGEDWDPVERRMWGNFPQAYSHIGLIHAAFAASPPW